MAQSSLPRLLGLFLLAYFTALGVYRFSIRGVAGAYDLLWLCNVVLVFAALAALARSQWGLRMACAAVAFSHLSWNIDVLSYGLAGVFPFGTASYVIWPQTSAWEIVSTLHHVWFIPLVAFVLRRAWGGPDARFHALDGLTGMLLPGLLVPTSFFITPKSHGETYLNVNMSHEFWPDAPWDFVKAFNGRHPMLGCAWVVLFGTVLNMAAWIVILAIQWVAEALFSTRRATNNSKKAN